METVQVSQLGNVEQLVYMEQVFPLPTSMIKRMYEHRLSSLNEVLLTYSALSLIWYVWTEYLKPL